MTARPIRQDEKRLISHLIELSKAKMSFEGIPSIVVDLQDAGMGSIKFYSKDERKFGEELIRVKYIDKDNMEVFICLDLDTENELFELDFWKVDFGKLIEYPRPEQLEVQ